MQITGSSTSNSFSVPLSQQYCCAQQQEQSKRGTIRPICYLILFCSISDCSWYTLSGSNEPLPVLSSSRVRLLGPILAIEAVTSEDAGTYKCAVANAGGEANAELRLTVSTPLHVEIMPNVLSVNMGATAEFRCVVSSNGMPMVSHHHITWIKVSILSPHNHTPSDSDSFLLLCIVLFSAAAIAFTPGACTDMNELKALIIIFLPFSFIHRIH